MAINEERSYTEYNVEVPTTDFPIGFDILDDGLDVVAVTLNDVDPTTLGYTVIQVNNTTYRFAPAVPSGVVRLSRITDIDQMAHVFTEGAIFISENMDGNFKQIRHAQQEVRDEFNKLATDTNEIIDTLQVVGEAAQDAAAAAEAAAGLANDAAAAVNDKVSYSDLDNAVDIAVSPIMDYVALPYKPLKSYKLYERVQLENGDIVKSTVANNIVNPNVDMTGWSNTSKKLISVSSQVDLIGSYIDGDVAYIQDLDANYIFKSGTWKPYIQVSAALNAFPKLAPEIGDEGRFLRAKESLQRQSIGSLTGLSCYTETVIEIPNGIYNINSEINLSAVAHIKSDGQAIIRQSDPTKDIFVLSNFYLTKIEGIKFFGGRRHISFSNANFDATLVKIYDCEFWESSEYSIYTIGTVAPLYHMSCHAVMRDCKFIACKKIAYNVCDKMEFYGGWVYLDYRNFDADSAAFMVAKGSLELHGVLGVPYLGENSASPRWKANARWVDNYGIFKANGTRFGGEDGGLPIVYNYSGAKSNLMGGIVSIKSCQINAGILSGRPDSGVIRLMTEVPFQIVIDTCDNLTNAPYISVDPTLDLTAYFAAVTNPQLRYKVRIDRNMTTFGGVTKLIPDQLLTFATGDIIPIPISAPKLISKTSLDSNRVQFVFELANTTIAQEFFITVSGTQNGGGSSFYRDFSTYIAGLFVGYGTSSIIKELAYTALQKPVTTKITTPTTKVEIESMYWGEASTGVVEQDRTSTNLRFSVVVKNCSGSVVNTAATINLLQTN